MLDISEVQIITDSISQSKGNIVLFLKRSAIAFDAKVPVKQQ